MRSIYALKDNWFFHKDATNIPKDVSAGEAVQLPHTWNALDGQDGGNDYFRGSCCYVRSIRKRELPAGEKYFLEIQGANSSAEVYVNGQKLAQHDGGYSTWRVDITEALQEENVLAVMVDNAANEQVYPQMADFTFYGGLYRGVSIITVPETHFDLEYYGGCGLQVTPVVQGEDAQVELKAWVKSLQEGDCLLYTIEDAEGQVVVAKKVVVKELQEYRGISKEETKKGVSGQGGLTEQAVQFTEVLTIPQVHLWHGRKDPYLYTTKVSLHRGEEELDVVSTRFGCRSFEIHPQKGFLLNGQEYPLRGVSRHQDRLGIGNALLPEHHEEDMELICEVGANTIRLAHYQHDQYFYDLCDEKGMVVWAEIPYISKHMPTAKENVFSQMKELIVQNYNHPSIVVWGLSNEITMNGAKDADLIQTHKDLNAMVHEMDSTRLTTVACVSMCGMDEEYVHITDVVSYNHYFGWYGGDTSMNGPWFDRFHAKYPNKPIGVSEYGCEGLNWHSSDPTQGDYTEEYQTYYHEELIKQLFTRPYIWATHVWNMFDFGADARAEGGENGQNHKGLVTMDRKYKKDAFYAYKAWLSDDPFVHLCGKRYIDRVEEVTKVTVYSNQPCVELFVNGESLGVQESKEHFFYFQVPNVGESTLVAVAGVHGEENTLTIVAGEGGNKNTLTAIAEVCRDESTLRKVEHRNEDYILKEKGAVLNWFDVEVVEGRFSLNDKMGDILQTLGGKLWFLKLGLTLKKKMSEAKKPAGDEEQKKGNPGFIITKDMMQMVGGFTVLRLTNMVSMLNISFTKEELLKVNAQLNKIRKPKKKDM